MDAIRTHYRNPKKPAIDRQIPHDLSTVNFRTYEIYQKK